MAARKTVSIHQLTIVNWNANGLRMKRASLIAFLSIHNIDIVCITETHFLSNESFSLPGYKIYRKDRMSATAAGGVAIFFKRCISNHAVLLPSVRDFQIVGIKIQCRDSNDFVLYCAYKPPSCLLNVDYLSLLFPADGSTLLLGDLNCKHTAWGCRVTNPNGQRLYNCINTQCLHILAPTEPTYYSYNPTVPPDILDIGIQKNMDLPTYITSVTALDSDHCPVLVTFHLRPNVADRRPRLINGYVHWEKFQPLLDSMLIPAQSLVTSSDIDHAVQHFTETISSCVRQSTTPLCRPKPRFYLPTHILQLIKEKHSIRRRWQQERQPWQRRKLNDLIRQIRHELDQHRLNSYQTYLSSISTGDNTLWEATKRILQEPNIIPPLRVNNHTFTETEAKCNILASYYEETFAPNNTDNNQNVAAIENELYGHMHKPNVPNRIIHTSPHELSNFIQKLPNKKSPGHDLIPNIVLKKLSRKALGYNGR